jgi:hypothetical protein
MSGAGFHHLTMERRWPECAKKRPVVRSRNIQRQLQSSAPTLLAMGLGRRRAERGDGPLNRLDTPKASAIGEIAAEAAIAASVAFRHGAPLETVRHALADRRAGPLGAALALIDAYQAQHKDSQQTGAD